MPYIKDPDRTKFIQGLALLPAASTAGELNYLFTMIALNYLETHGLSYANLNDISGALTNCNLELYRRIAGPYEDKKIDENGDVYSKDVIADWLL